jgi:hypothetical protein
VSESLHDDTRHVTRCNGDQKLIFSDKLVDDCANDRFDLALRFFDAAFFGMQVDRNQRIRELRHEQRPEWRLNYYRGHAMSKLILHLFCYPSACVML